MHALWLWRLHDENTRINFILKWNSVSKNFWIRESTWIFLTKLCHYHLSEDRKTPCMHYQKWSQQYAEEKSTFLRCEDLRVSWDLNWFNWIYKSSILRLSEIFLSIYCLYKRTALGEVFESLSRVFLKIWSVKTIVCLIFLIFILLETLGAIHWGTQTILS